MINKMSILKKSMVGGLAISFMILSAINVFAATAADPTKQGDIVCRNNRFFVERDQKAQLGLFYKESIHPKVITHRVMQLRHTYDGTIPYTRWDDRQTLSEFKAEEKYWGAKYPGKGNADLLTVIKTARDHINQYPSVDWTDTSIAIPGQTITATLTEKNKQDKKLPGVTKQIKPKFRSDTFVNWAHWYGNSTAMMPVAQIVVNETLTPDKYAKYWKSPEGSTYDWVAVRRLVCTSVKYDYVHGWFDVSAKDAWNKSEYKLR